SSSTAATRRSARTSPPSRTSCWHCRRRGGSRREEAGGAEPLRGAGGGAHGERGRDPRELRATAQAAGARIAGDVFARGARRGAGAPASARRGLGGALGRGGAAA